jgi:hypothetical protein
MRYSLMLTMSDYITSKTHLFISRRSHQYRKSNLQHPATCHFGGMRPSDNSRSLVIMILVKFAGSRDAIMFRKCECVSASQLSCHILAIGKSLFGPGFFCKIKIIITTQIIIRGNAVTSNMFGRDKMGEEKTLNCYTMIS